MIIMLLAAAALVDLRGVKHYGDMREITKDNWNGHSNKKKQSIN